MAEDAPIYPVVLDGSHDGLPRGSAILGLRADIRTLISGGKPLAILLILATTFIFLQNLVGIGAATVFGMEPVAGLMVGSISLTGGVGTALAWAPTFVETLGISNALEIGVAANTVGLISACVIGGPIALYLIKKHKIAAKGDEQLDVGVEQGVIDKSGSWYSFDGERIGQGRENVKRFLTENADISDIIYAKLREKLGLAEVPAKEAAAASDEGQAK